MAVNDFIVNLVAGLSKTKSKQQIKSDAKSLGDMKFVKLIGNLDMPKTRKAIKAQLKGLNNLTFNITPNVNTKGVQTATKQAINNAQRVANSNKVHLNFDTSKQQLVNQIKILGRNNNKLFSDREMTAKYNQLLNSANVAKSTGELKTLRGELSAFKTELVATNKGGMTAISKFKQSMGSYAKFFSGASMIYALSNQVRNAVTEAKTLDDSLVDLQKVTNEIGDRDALYKYFDKSLSKAQELNVKVGSLIDAVTEFKKLGWDLDDAELGAKWANILSNVGDVDIDTAIGSIKTSIASFDEIGGYGNDQMDKKLEAYTDLVNNMSNKYSIDAEGLAESIRLSAGTLTEAHMSIEQAATMFATANKYYNDPSYLGNTAKIGSLRMRASSGDTDAIEELQEMGEEVDDLATATSNLREKLMALTGVDIMKDEHTFKSYYDQLYEISQVMDKLDDTSRANVLETMFGKSRAAAGAALLSGLKSEGVKAYEDAINSAGSATEEYQTWMTGADAACQRFSNTLTETYQGIINGNTVRDLANLGSAVLEFANNWGIVEGTLKGVIALGIGKFLTTGTMALITATKQVEQYGKALQMASNVPNGNLSARFQTLKSVAQATSTLTTEQLRNVLATNTLTQADRVRILQMQGMTKEMALQKLAEMNLTQATNAQTAANTASTASTFSLKAAMIGLGATLKSVFLSNPVGIVLMGISLGVSAVTSAVSKHNQAVEEARQKAKEAADNANTLGDEIATLANKYIQLSDAVKTDASAKDDLMTTQTELLKKLGLEGESIDDLIAKYGSLSNAIKQASIDSLKNQQTDLIAGVNAAKEELMDVAKDNFWGTNNIISASGEEAVKAFKELEKAGVIDSGSYGTGGGQLVLIGDDTVEGALENYKKLEDAVNALRDSEAFTADELSDNSLFNSIYSRYSEMKESVEAYNSSIDNLNENLAQQTMLTALQGNELPKTEEDFNKFKQELIDTAVASKQFIGSEKEITDAINNYLSTVPEFEGYYSIPLENELDKVDELLNQEDFSKTSADFKTLNDSLSTLTENAELLSKVNKEISESGRVSAENLKKINEAFPKDKYPEMTKALYQYENGLINSTQLFEKLEEAYNTDSENYAENVKSKAETDNNYYSILKELYPSLFENLQSLYQGDFDNWKNLAEAKKGVELKLISEIGSAWKAYYNVFQTEDGSYDYASTGVTVDRGGDTGDEDEARELENAAMDKYKADAKKFVDGMNEALAEINKLSPDITAPSWQELSPDTSKSSSKDSTDAWKEEAEKQIKLLDHYHNMGYLSDEQYYKALNELNEKYYAGQEKYLDDYRSYAEKIYSGLKQAYSDMLNKQKDYMGQAINAVTGYLDDQIDALNDQKDAAEDEYNARIEALESEQDLLDEQKDAIEEQKNAIQEQIDAIDKANEARQKAIDLQKKQYELNRAMNQNTNKVYVNGQMVWQTDDSAITDARNDLEDAKAQDATDKLQDQIDELDKASDALDKQKDALQNQIDSLNDELDKVTEGIEKQIDELQKYKDRWAEIPDQFTYVQNQMIASMMLGQDWQQKALSMNEDMLYTFGTSYNNIQGQLQLVTDASAQDIVNMAQLSGEQLGILAAQADESLTEMGGSIQGQSEISEEALNQLMLAGTDSLSTLASKVGESSQSVCTSIGDIIAKASDAITTLNQLSELQDKMDFAPIYSGVTVTAMRNGGVVEVETARKGTVTGSHRSKIAKSLGEDHLVVAREGEGFVPPEQVKDVQDSVKAVNKFADLLIPAEPKFKFDNFDVGQTVMSSNLIKQLGLDFNGVSNTTSQNNTIKIESGAIVLNEVTKPDVVGEAIIKELPNYVTRKLNQR